MSRLRFRISMSLDGFVAGPSQAGQPARDRRLRLHEWVFPLTVWRASQASKAARSMQQPGRRGATAHLAPR